MDRPEGSIDLAGEGTFSDPERRRGRDGAVCVVEVSLHDVTGEAEFGPPRRYRLLRGGVLPLEDARPDQLIARL